MIKNLSININPQSLIIIVIKRPLKQTSIILIHTHPFLHIHYTEN